MITYQVRRSETQLTSIHLKPPRAQPDSIPANQTATPDGHSTRASSINRARAAGIATYPPGNGPPSWPLEAHVCFRFSGDRNFLVLLELSDDLIRLYFTPRRG